MTDAPPTFEVIARTADLLHGSFWWHAGYRDFFDSNGVPLDLIENAYSTEGSHKALICRSILKQLLQKGNAGAHVAWRVIDSARELTGPVHKEAGSQASFDERRAKLEAALAGRVNRVAPSEDDLSKERQGQFRASELDAIRGRFWELMSELGGDPVKRGYELEELIGRLCRAYDVEYDPPRRTPGQQIDGAIKFQGRHLVIEARWRKDKADFGDIQKLSGKAKARIVGTLGLFLSMEGFTSDGVDLWLRSGNQRDCILLQGAEFVKVVNGYVSWADALQQMIDQAAIRGDVLVKLSV